MNKAELTLLDHVEHAVFVIEPDADGGPVYAMINAFGLRYLDLPLDQIIGRRATELYPGDAGRLAYVKQLTALHTGLTSSYRTTLPIRGEEHSFHTTLSPVTNADGRVIRLIGSTRDLGDAEGLTDHGDRIEGATREIMHFVHLAAHDLRAPLNQIKGIADLLRESLDDDDTGAAELLDMLDQVGDHARTVIADVLDHARSTAVEPDISSFDLRDLVDDIREMLDPLGRVSFRVSARTVTCDRSALKITLRNLIDNAQKYARPKGDGDDRLRLTISAQEGPSGFVEFSVGDNGSGFVKPGAIFAARSALNRGGFGLLGVQQLIRARGGEISARNGAKGSGAVISFTLPGRIRARSAKRLAS